MGKDIDPKSGEPEASEKTKRLAALEAAHGELAERVQSLEEKVEALTPKAKEGDEEGDW